MFVNCSPKSEKEIGIYLDVNKGKEIVFGNGQLELKFNNRLRCQVQYADKHLLLNEANDSTLPPHYIISDNGTIAYFTLNYDVVVIKDITNEFGNGKQLILKGVNQQAGFEKRLTAALYQRQRSFILLRNTFLECTPVESLK